MKPQPLGAPLKAAVVRWTGGLKRSEGLLKARFGQPEPSMNPGPDAARTRLTGACSAEGFKRLPRSLELSFRVNPDTQPGGSPAPTVNPTAKSCGPR